MMSKSTVYRFLQTMKSLGYVRQEGENDKYALTLKLFDLGAKALQHVDLIRIADVQMRMLSKETKETIHLGTMEDDSIVYLHKIDSMYNLRMYSVITSYSIHYTKLYDHNSCFHLIQNACIAHLWLTTFDWITLASFANKCFLKDIANV